GLRPRGARRVIRRVRCAARESRGNPERLDRQRTDCRRIRARKPLIMRLGGPVDSGSGDPEKWIANLRKEGYRTAYCPIDLRASDSMIAEYASAARENDVVIAEVGAWSNLLSPSAAEREDALKLCVQALVVADKL